MVSRHHWTENPLICLSAWLNGYGHAPLDFCTTNLVGPGSNPRVGTVDQAAQPSGVSKLVALVNRWVTTHWILRNVNRAGFRCVVCGVQLQQCAVTARRFWRLSTDLSGGFVYTDCNKHLHFYLFYIAKYSVKAVGASTGLVWISEGPLQFIPVSSSFDNRIGPPVQCFIMNRRASSVSNSELTGRLSI